MSARSAGASRRAGGTRLRQRLRRPGDAAGKLDVLERAARRRGTASDRRLRRSRGRASTTGWTSKCRWYGVPWPRRPCCRRSRAPRRPSRASRSPRGSCRRKGGRSRTRSRPCPAARAASRRSSFQPTEKTVPSATARIGAPSGAKMSSPWCQPPGHVAARRAERVAVARRPVDREDVAARGQLRRHGGGVSTSGPTVVQRVSSGFGGARRLARTRSVASAPAGVRPARSVAGRRDRRGRRRRRRGRSRRARVGVGVADAGSRSPRADPPWSASRWTTSAVTLPRYAGAAAFRSPSSSTPRAGRVAPVAERDPRFGEARSRLRRARPGWSRTRIAEVGRARSRARAAVTRATTASAVISPPNSESPVTSARRGRRPVSARSAVAFTVVDAAAATEPSAGYANDASARAASGRALAARSRRARVWSAATIWTASPVASRPGARRDRGRPARHRRQRPAQ